MHFIDLVAKILVPILAALLSGVGIVLLGRWGRRQKQAQIVDLATKRINFWDTYLKTALATANSDPGVRTIFEQEVRISIRRVREETAEELRIVAWRRLIAERRVSHKPLRGWQRFLWFACFVLRGLFLAAFVGLFLLYSDRIFFVPEDVGFRMTTEFLFAWAVLVGVGVALALQMDAIKYPKPDAPIIDDL